MLLILLNGLRNVGKIVNKLKDMEENKMDYIVEYSVNGEIKIEVVSFGDFMGDLL